MFGYLFSYIAINTPKKLAFWTAAIFQLKVKTTVYRKQKHENALLKALPFKDFVITFFSLQYFASEFISPCVRTFAVHPAMWPCWDATISQLSVVSNVLKWLNNGSLVAKPHKFFEFKHLAFVTVFGCSKYIHTTMCQIIFCWPCSEMT